MDELRRLSPSHRSVLGAVALFGLLGPNGVFLYYALLRPDEFWGALSNPVTLAFLTEAFVVMILLAVFLHVRPMGPWGWKSFVVMSLLGGLGFSIPALVLLNGRIPSK